MKKYIFALGLFLIFIVVLFFLRGNEDTWICRQGVWVKHGHPNFDKPITSCSGKSSLPKNQEDCLKIGGLWSKLGPDPIETCNVKALDRGNLCTDSSQCEGLCLAELSAEEMKQGMSGKQFKKTGNCSVWRVTLGCRGIVTQGVVSILCID